MARIIHLIQDLSKGGAARATIYLAKYSKKIGNHEHAIISLKNADPQAVLIAKHYGISVLSAPDDRILLEMIEGADIVQWSFWNNPDSYRTLRMTLPPIRSIGWFHVGGTSSPQVITPKLVDHFDCAVACSPFTYLCSSFQTLSDDAKRERTGMVYGATDFERLSTFQSKTHDGFHVGYLGTIDFLKMHRNFVSMSVNAKISDAKFIVAGSGEAISILKAESETLSAANQFEFRGYTEDVSDFLSTLDVYGYPLCCDTYAASEMNLQEVMYAGIPPVVFPYGGIKELVQHNQTGLIVQTEQEYSDALRFLYEHPEERKRLGQNAKEYACKVFGAENAAIAMNEIYERLLRQQKRVHVWGGTEEQKRSGRVRSGMDDKLFAATDQSGHRLFIESLGDTGDLFVRSMLGKTALEKMRADQEILFCSPVLRQSGISPYRRAYPSDPYLAYWNSVAQLGAGMQQAIVPLIHAAEHLEDWRIIILLKWALRSDDQKMRAHIEDMLRQRYTNFPEQEWMVDELLETIQ